MNAEEKDRQDQPPQDPPPQEQSEQTAGEEGGEEDGKTPPLPKPTLSGLAHMLFMQGMIAAGKMISPVTNRYETDLNMAKHQVELLELLHEKTQGNRTKEEDDLFDEILHQLRLAYVDAAKPR
jgi:hypothetical protein